MSRLSIFSFRTLQPWRNYPAGLLTCLIVLILVELFVARSNWIVERYPASSLGIVTALESEVIRGARPEIVCFGNSRLRDGIAPRVLEKHFDLSEGTVLNLAITAGSPYDSLGLYTRNRKTLRHAKIMIIDFEYCYLAHPPRLTPRVSRYATFEDRVRMFQGRKELVPALVGGIWQTFGLRHYLAALICDPTKTDAMVIGEDGRIEWRDADADQQIDVEKGLVRRGERYDYEEFDSGHVRELRRLISLARDDGMTIVLLHVPLRDEFVAHLQSARRKQYEKLCQVFSQSDFDVDLKIDWERGSEIGIPDECFYDYGHLNDTGSQQLSRAVAEQLNTLVNSKSSAGVRN